MIREVEERRRRKQCQKTRGVPSFGTVAISVACCSVLKMEENKVSTEGVSVN